MAQFDVYENNDPDSKGEIPFLLDVQHDLHRNLVTRSVIPLLKVSPGSSRIDRLCPLVIINSETCCLSTPELAGYPVADFGKKVGNLEKQRVEIFAAIDFLLSGF